MYIATMNATTEWVRSILQKGSLDDCSIEELQSIAGQYSYFTPIQLMLAEKLKATNDTRYGAQLQKLSLHFNNPLWLDYLLNGYRLEEVIDLKIKSELPGEETISNETDILEQYQPTGSSTEGTTEIPSEISPDAQEEIIGSKETDIEDENLVRQYSEKETLTEEEDIDPSLENEESQELSISMPPLPDLNQQPTETELSFQPYHTVDYFASQGIKYASEEKSKDRFSTQLRSFTEWLKTMKRLPQAEATKTDMVSEQKVQQLADHSIDEGEVVTETMAEVWVKQGNKEKAIETYNKLSLLNPDKSAYFASLVEQLKNS
jgi:hypothetical protein